MILVIIARPQSKKEAELGEVHDTVTNIVQGGGKLHTRLVYVFHPL